MTSPINTVQYSGFDFSTILDSLLNNLQVNFATTYNDFAVSSLGIVILDMVAAAGDFLSFYIDRRATDLYLSTARSAASVANAARQLGYKMAPATASSVDITISPTVAQTFIIPLPIGFQIQSPDGSIWECAQAYSWPANNTTPQTITFSQTQTLQTTFTSDGTANQVFNFGNIPTNEFLVGPGTDGVSQITVTINNQTWTEEPLLVFGQTNEFEVGYNDSPPTLRFGDSIAGNIPPTNAQISVTFKASRGTAGQVTSGQIMSVVTPLSVNFTTINFNLAVPTGSSGGSNPEDISSAKANAPNFFKARGVNVTQEDYNVRAGSYVDSVFGAIAVASAIPVFGANSDALLQTLVNEIVATSEEYVTAVAAAVTSANASLTTILSIITNIINDNTSISTYIGNATTASSSLSTASAAAQTASGLTSTYIAQSVSNVTSLISAISGVASGSSDQLTVGTASAINTILSTLQTLLSQANVQIALTVSDVSTINTEIANIQTQLANVVTVQADIDTQTANATTNINTTTTTLTTLLTTVNGIDNNVENLGEQIIAHVDSFLASDCQSNLIEVPILAYDSDGFYTAPTIALIQSLQAYLNNNKELTQVVAVFDGSEQLIDAVIVANVDVLPGYVQTVITSQVEAAILGVLKGRAFGDSLYLSELYWAISPNTANAIPGIDAIDIAITGPSANLDGYGNLIINQNEVVTRGSITITSEVVS